MSIFKFKQFSIQQDQCAMKVGMDGVLLGAWANIKSATSILDIGTGTALLALMMAQRSATSVIDAVEIDDLAYQQATHNVAQSAWNNRIKLYSQSIQEFAKQQDPHYSLIISNPPFFGNENTLANSKQRQLARSTHSLSHLELLTIVQQLLIPQKGVFCLILPIQEGEQFILDAPKYGLYLKKLTKVIPRAGKQANRLLIELCNFEIEQAVHTKLIVRNQGTVYHDYTSEYIDLCKAFYLKM